MRRSLLVRTVIVTAAATLVAACGSSTPKTPQSTLKAGISGIGHTSSLTITTALDTTPQALIALAQQMGDKLSPTVAAGLASASFVIEIRDSDGKDLSTLKPGSTKGLAVDLALKAGGQTLAEIIGIDSTLYVQAEVASALGLLGRSKLYGELQARAATLPKFVQAFVAGKWVSLDLTSALGAMSQFGIAAPGAQQWAAFAKAFDGLITSDVKVTRVGSDSQGDHLQLSAQTKKLVGDLVLAVTSNIPISTFLLSKVKVASLPDTAMTADAWVKDGTLSKLSVDLTQFAKPGSTAAGGGHLPLVVTFDRSGGSAITAPTGATAVDVSQLFTLLGSLLGRGSG